MLRVHKGSHVFWEGFGILGERALHGWSGPQEEGKEFYLLSMRAGKGCKVKAGSAGKEKEAGDRKPPELSQGSQS